MRLILAHPYLRYAGRNGELALRNTVRRQDRDHRAEVIALTRNLAMRISPVGRCAMFLPTTGMNATWFTCYNCGANPCRPISSAQAFKRAANDSIRPGVKRDVGPDNVSAATVEPLAEWTGTATADNPSSRSP